ncbi:hypothetical protein DEA8626_00402 [Defluviimonas aquaemixtae]|uniref:Gfo/Idh/MocA-like oxidoreductase N-terminal domain-containing protein n=1 Tax=Albidovulum aquaemixtae TaxID=1542388 RepID=A0A2R8B2R9_9RHOB|nr:hypothetical protein [Defluviimonas aquaemixtae]SPH16888.1 hypothetical protein DEA8626_00402 [Defluviimonas aquaemixtae]
MKNVLLIGCGNIGFRHLQALGSAVKGGAALNLTVVEPNLSSHGRIAAYLASLGAATQSALFNELPPGPGAYDLAILATNSAARRAAFDAVHSRYTLKSVVFEKVLFPTLGDLDAVAATLQRDRVAGYVNCGRRTAPGYQALQSALSSTPVDIIVTGANYGLGSNAIHFLDLAEFLNSASIEAMDAAGLQPGSVPSKRYGYVEIFGTISARLSNGATIRVTCDRDGDPNVVVHLTAGSEEFEIDETGRRLIRGGVAEDFAMRHVSELTDTYLELLNEGHCVLTPYADSTAQHRFFLSELLKHFGQPAEPDEVCPVS